MANDLTRSRLTPACEPSRNGRTARPAPAKAKPEPPAEGRNPRWLTFTVVVLVLGAGFLGARKLVLSARDKKTLDPADGLVCLLVNEHSGRCLSIEGGADKPGAKIVQGPKADEARAPERWILVQGQGGAFKLLNEHSQKFLEVPGGNKNKGVQAMQWHEGPNLPHQAWAFEKAGNAYVLKAKHSGQALGVGQGSKDEGAAVVQWDRSDGVADQQWVLKPVRQ